MRSLFFLSQRRPRRCGCFVLHWCLGTQAPSVRAAPAFLGYCLSPCGSMAPHHPHVCCGKREGKEQSCLFLLRTGIGHCIPHFGSNPIGQSLAILTVWLHLGTKQGRNCNIYLGGQMPNKESSSCILMKAPMNTFYPHKIKARIASRIKITSMTFLHLCLVKSNNRYCSFNLHWRGSENFRCCPSL